MAEGDDPFSMTLVSARGLVDANRAVHELPPRPFVSLVQTPDVGVGLVGYAAVW
jgi:hypothetical protein